VVSVSMVNLLDLPTIEEAEDQTKFDFKSCWTV